MKPKSIAGVLFKVDNLEITVDFYEKLGFRVGNRDKNHVTLYVNWFWVEFILAVSQGTTPGNGQFLYVSVENADEYFMHLKDRGIEPLTEPKDYENGRREILVRDPDGYTIVFFQKIK